MFVIGFVAIFLVFQVATFVYVWLQAVVGRAIGATVERISVGCGPILFSRYVNGTEWCLSALPFGGYTKFHGQDEIDLSNPDEPISNPEESGQRRFNDTPVLGRILLMLVGPISNGVMGILLMLIPVQMQAAQLEVNPLAPVPIEPTGVPGLGLSTDASTIAGQFRVFDESFIEYWRGLHFFGRDGWGGPLTTWITCGVSAEHGIYAWLTCMGIVLVGIMVFNLAPVPILNGGHVLFLMAEALGFKPSGRVIHWLAVVGLLVVLLSFSGMVFADFRWLAAHFRELL